MSASPKHAYPNCQKDKGCRKLEVFVKVFILAYHHDSVNGVSRDCSECLDDRHAYNYVKELNNQSYHKEILVFEEVVIFLTQYLLKWIGFVQFSVGIKFVFACFKNSAENQVNEY